MDFSDGMGSIFLTQIAANNRLLFSGLRFKFTSGSLCTTNFDYSNNYCSKESADCLPA